MNAPRLRPDVTVTPGPAGSARIVDAASGFEIEVDGGVARLLAAIDGRRGPQELRAALAGEGVLVEAADVARVLALLDSMFLLDDERGRARAAAARAERRARRTVLPVARALPGARFDCHACGYCCSNGQNFGPIPVAERDRILAHDWSGEIEGDLFYEVGGRIYLDRREGRCVFLTAQNRCRVHERLGVEAKPTICRLFPFAVARTPEGTLVSIRHECKSLALSRASGTLVAGAQAEAAARLLGEGIDEPIRIGALVQWTSDIVAPYETAAALREAALAALERPGRGADDGQRAVRDIVLGCLTRLGGRPGEAEIAAAQAFARERAGGASAGAPDGVPEPARAAGREALASILSEMADAAARNYFFLKSEGKEGATRIALQEDAILTWLTLLARAGGRGAPPFDHERLAAIDATPGDPIFRDAARQEIFGWQVAARQPLAIGYALLALRYIVAKWAARRRAAAREAAAIAEADAHEGLLLATRALAAPAAHRAATRDPRRLLAFYRGFDPGA